MTREQIIAKAAKALDRHGLKQRGWSDEDIERAMDLCPTPSPSGLQMAEVFYDSIFRSPPRRPYSRRAGKD